MYAWREFSKAVTRLAEIISGFYKTIRNKWEKSRAWKNWDSEGNFINRKELKRKEYPKKYSIKERLKQIDKTYQYRRSQSKTFSNTARTTLMSALVVISICFVWTAPSPAEASALNKNMGIQSIRISNLVAPQEVVREEFTAILYTLVQWPTSDHSVTQGLGNFGYRSCRGCSSNHLGSDFNPGGGTPVRSVSEGLVLSSGWAGGLGETVSVQHNVNGQNVVTRYSHMQSGSLQVAEGQVIDRGTVLGLVGSTGASSGNHLHFQVEIGGVPIDPIPWLLENVNI